MKLLSRIEVAKIKIKKAYLVNSIEIERGGVMKKSSVNPWLPVPWNSHRQRGLIPEDHGVYSIIL